MYDILYLQLEYLANRHNIYLRGSNRILVITDAKLILAFQGLKISLILSYPSLRSHSKDPRLSFNPNNPSIQRNTGEVNSYIKKTL